MESPTYKLGYVTDWNRVDFSQKLSNCLPKGPGRWSFQEIIPPGKGESFINRYNSYSLWVARNVPKITKIYYIFVSLRLDLTAITSIALFWFQHVQTRPTMHGHTEAEKAKTFWAAVFGWQQISGWKLCFITCSCWAKTW